MESWSLKLAHLLGTCSLKSLGQTYGISQMDKSKSVKMPDTRSDLQSHVRFPLVSDMPSTPSQKSRPLVRTCLLGSGCKIRRLPTERIIPAAGADPVGL